MSYVDIWIHAVFCTKFRRPYLLKAHRKKVFKHIKAEAKKKGIWISRINGFEDHCHCLIILGPTQSISKVIKDIKGESSKWIKEQGILEEFEWQPKFYAASVSRSHVPMVSKYIENQEAHHAHQSTEQEFSRFREKYGFKEISDDEPD